MQPHGSNYFAHRTPPPPPPDPGDGIKSSNLTVSEQGHVAYPINGNHEMQKHGSKCFAHRTPLPFS